VLEGASPVTVHGDVGLFPAQDPVLTALPVLFMTQVVPSGFEGGVQVSVALVEVWDVTERLFGAASAPAVASPYVPEPVAEK
jgi:hypothetical protein